MGRILKSAMDKDEVKWNAKLRSDYFSVNVSLLAILFCREISGKIVGFLKFVGEIQELVQKRSQKSNKDIIFHYISLSIYQLLFPKFCSIQKQ